MLIRYSYERVPTIRQFAQDDTHRWRMLLGPFGCLPSTTEYFSYTYKRWKPISEYEPNEQIAVYNPKDDTLTYERPLDYIKLPHRDFWINIHSSKFVNMVFSPEHTIAYLDYKNEFKSENVFKFIKTLSSKKVANNFTIRRKTNNNHINPNLLKLVVLLSADGHKVNKNTYTVSVRKKRKIERLKYILEALNIKYKVANYHTRPTEFVFTIKVNLPFEFDGTTFPSEFYNLTSNELDIIIDECLKWDGNIYNNDRRYFTTNRYNADFIQFAAHATNRRAYISKVIYSNSKWKSSYIVWISKKNVKTKYTAGLPKDEVITYIDAKDDEYKYCFTTSTGFFLVRQNGSIFITGNSGKSSGCVMEIIRRSLQQRPSPRDGIRRARWAVIRATFRKLRDTTIKTFLDWLPPSIFGEYKVATHDYIITAFPNTRIEIMFRALDRPEDVTNLLSLELTGAWVNEAKEIQEDIIHALDGRIGRYPSIRDGGPTWYGIIMDTNPPDEDHWIYRIFEEEKPPHTAIYKQPSGLSPQAENMLTWEEWEKIQNGEYTDEDEIPGGLRPDYYIKLSEGKSQDFIDVYVHGKYGAVKEGKPIFERTFNPDIHIAKEPINPIQGLLTIIGMDFGLTPSAILMQLTPKGRLIVFDELYEEGIGIEQFTSTILKPHLSSKYYGFKFMVIGDPAGMQRSQTDEKTCFEVLRDYNFQVKPARSNAISYRINAIEYFLTKLVDGLPAFQVSPNCKMIIKGFTSKYCWRKKRDGSTSQEIEKNKWSHPMDALGYGATYYYQQNSKPKFVIPKIKRRPASYVAGY